MPGEGHGDRQVSDQGIQPECPQRENRPQRKQWTERLTRFNPVGQLAAQHVSQADPGQNYPNHARPNAKRGPNVLGHQPAGHQFQNHDAKAARKSEQIRSQAIEQAKHDAKGSGMSGSAGRFKKP